MSPTPPDPPAGVRDLHDQPGLEKDGRLFELRETLESDLPDDVFADLSRFLPRHEPDPSQTEAYRERALTYVSECIDYRNAIRPEELRSLDELPAEVGRTTAENWVWYWPGYEVKHNRPVSDATTEDHGKYLLFAPGSPRELEDVILEEFPQYPSGAAKLPTIQGKREDWVLCLYQSDNRYWYDVREAHHDPPRVKFRGYEENGSAQDGDAT